MQEMNEGHSRNGEITKVSESGRKRLLALRSVPRGIVDCTDHLTLSEARYSCGRGATWNTAGGAHGRAW